MNTATRKRRLTKLADRLAKVQEERFDMALWAAHNGEHSPEEDNFCGTAACALGHAAMIPAFKRAGLGLDWFLRDEGNPDKGWSAFVRFDGFDSEDAGAAFFGLSAEEANKLFLDTNATRKEVIKNIRKLAKLPYKREYGIITRVAEESCDESCYICNSPL
jgi:hypothetical protein